MRKKRKLAARLRMALALILSMSLLTGSVLPVCATHDMLYESSDVKNEPADAVSGDEAGNSDMREEYSDDMYDGETQQREEALREELMREEEARREEEGEPEEEEEVVVKAQPSPSSNVSYSEPSHHHEEEVHTYAYAAPASVPEVVEEIIEIAEEVPPLASVPEDVVPEVPAQPVQEPVLWKTGTQNILFDAFLDPDTKETVDAEKVMFTQNGLTGTIRIRKDKMRKKREPFRVLDGKVSFDMMGEETVNGETYVVYQFSAEGQGANWFAVDTKEETIYSPWIVVEDLSWRKAPKPAPAAEEEPIVIVDAGIVQTSGGGSFAVVPEVLIGGERIDPDSVAITVQGETAPAQSVDMMSLDTSASGSYHIVQSEPVEVKDKKGQRYEVKVTATDVKGREVSGSLQYLTDDLGSVYLPDAATNRLLTSHYTNNPPRIGLTQMSKVQLRKQEITIAGNGTITKLMQGESYTVREEETESGWSYTYLIDELNFMSDGLYSIDIYTETVDGGAESSRSAGIEIDFVLDETMPAVLTDGIESDSVYAADKHIITVWVSDNTDVVRAVFYNDDTEVAFFSAEAIEALNGQLDVTLREDDVPHTIRIEVEDAAGNITTTVFNNVLISSDGSLPDLYESGIGLTDRSLSGGRSVGRAVLWMAALAALTSSVLFGTSFLRKKVRKK